MKRRYQLFFAVALLILPACERSPMDNRQNGIKDAMNTRPHEEIRDATEDAGDAVKEAGQDVKDAVNGN